MSLRILHIAPFNTSGVPIALVQAECRLGHDSRLVTLGRDWRNYEEDFCLELPFLNFWGTRLAKQAFSDPNKLRVTNRQKKLQSIPLYWRPNGLMEKILIRLRERIWEKKVFNFFRESDFWNFDVYQLDGGLEFYRDGRIVRQLKSAGKKILCCYTGSDLRTRGVMPEIDALCDSNVTFEFDHLKLHPNIHHVFFPFDVTAYDTRPEPHSEIIKIGHAPTNREAKGSARIIAVINELRNEHAIELVLIENLPHKESLQRKSDCHIFVDQLGDLGYGLNGLEALAMGIPTCSCLAPGFTEHYGNHPFVAIDEESLKGKLVELVLDKKMRKKLGRRGREWVKKHHDARKIVQEIHHIARLDLSGKKALSRNKNSTSKQDRPYLTGTLSAQRVVRPSLN